MTLLQTLSRNSRATLKALQANSNRSQKAIAREVGVSEPAVSKIVSQLTMNGYIKRIGATLVPEKLGLEAVGFFKVNYDCSESANVAAAAIMRRPEVLELHFTEAHQLFMKVRVHTNAELGEFKRSIGSLEVSSMHVMIALRTVKETLEVSLG
jgi:DNA-binding Lrp family transcriptional regulator